MLPCTCDIFALCFDVEVIRENVEWHFLKCPTFPETYPLCDRLIGMLAEGRRSMDWNAAAFFHLPLWGCMLKGAQKLLFLLK